MTSPAVDTAVNYENGKCKKVSKPVTSNKGLFWFGRNLLQKKIFILLT